MATEYALNLKAQLDTSEVEAKLQSMASGAGAKTSSASLTSLENSIKKLNASIEKLNNTASKPESGTSRPSNSWSKYSTERRLLRAAAGYYVGHQLGQYGAEQIAAGNVGAGVAASGASGVLRGAAMGAGFGPWGILAGAAIGGLTDAMDALVKSAERANEVLTKQAELQSKQIKEFHNVQKDFALQEELAGFTALSDEELLKITTEQKAAETTLKEFMTPGSKSAKRFASWYKGEDSKDYIADRDKEMKRLQEEVKKAEVRGAAAQAILEKRGLESIYGSRSEKAAPALSKLLAPTSSQASVGYDVGGYGGFGSIAQQQLQQERQTAQNTKAVAQETKKLTLVSQNLYTYLINRDMVSAKRLGAEWQ